MDECEIFGELMLDSLLARSAPMSGQGCRQGSAWVGILLIIGAIAPVVLGTAIFKGQSTAAVVVKKGDSIGIRATGADVTNALDRVVPTDKPMATSLRRISLNKWSDAGKRR